MSERPYRCLWVGCTYTAPVGSLAYQHMTTCPYRPKETR